jgi:7-cyano-7-deazaguanine synthase in queuosine biosynthesis
MIAKQCFYCGKNIPFMRPVSWPWWDGPSWWQKTRDKKEPYYHTKIFYSKQEYEKLKTCGRCPKHKTTKSMCRNALLIHSRKIRQHTIPR